MNRKKPRKIILFSFRYLFCSTMMFQVEEVPPPQSVLLNGTLLKSEVIEQPVPILTPISITESSLAPPSVTQAQLITVPIASAQPLLTSTPTATIKRAKRVDFCRFFSSNLMYFFRDFELISIPRK
jgi:hypothetical protein